MPIEDPESKAQVDQLAINARDFGVEYFNEHDHRQGVVHIIGPEQGFTLPGATIVCGDSHTSTHGAFGALAHGIGTSEVEHVLATQTLIQAKAKNMLVKVNGSLHEGVSAKDITLAIIGKIGTAGGTGYVIEYAGEAIEALSIEGRMTVCNMSIEGGARAGLIAPDEKTFAYLQGSPQGAEGRGLGAARCIIGRSSRAIRARITTPSSNSTPATLPPLLTWGTSPEDVVTIDGLVPTVESAKTEAQRAKIQRALDYMGLKGGEKPTDIEIDRVFIGSCTNGRIEDLRAAAKIAEGRKVSGHVNALVVPGSGLVKEQAEAEGLDKIFLAAGFEWREPGCSMCLAMNPDRLAPGRTLRLDLEPQFRRPSGLQRPHPSRLPRHGGGGGDRRAFRRFAHLQLSQADTDGRRMNYAPFRRR